MIQATLIRSYKGQDGTIGKLLIDGKMICQTLERPLEYNKKQNLSDDKTTTINESCCVPESEYEVDWTWSPHFQKGLFLLLGTSSREGIRFHVANHIDQLLGCVAPCMSFKRATVKGKTYEFFGVNSKAALDLLYKQIPKDKNGKYEKWKLKITSDTTLCTV